MDDDAQLLGRFVDASDQAAFAELVQRHVNLVHGAALRQVGGSAHLAEDVTQAVFVALAQTAPRLCRHTSLAGWLFTSTRFLAAKTRRTQLRWQLRQQEVHTMQTLASEDGAGERDWRELRPVIDDAMHELPASDCEIILQRYFEGRALEALVTRYGLAENTVRMRVERALERLRRRLVRRGITSTAGALGLALASQPATAAPSGLAAAATSASLAGSLAVGAGTATGISILTFMSTTKITLGAAAALILGLGVVTYRNNRESLARAEEVRAQKAQLDKLRAENLSLRKSNHTLSAAVDIPPPAQPAVPGPAVETATLTPLGARLAEMQQNSDQLARAAGFRDGILQSHAEVFQKLGITPEQVDAYIKMRYEQMQTVNRIAADAETRGEEARTTADLVAQSNGAMWEGMKAVFGDAIASGLQEFVANQFPGRAGSVRGVSTANSAVASQMTPGDQN